MIETEGNNNFNKAGYDSRLHFSKFIVELKEMLLRCQTIDYKTWIYGLRTFQSHMYGLVPPKKLNEWETDFNKIANRYNISMQNRDNIYNPEVDLFEMQGKMFAMTAPLYLPINDEDVDDEIDFDRLFAEEKM